MTALAFEHVAELNVAQPFMAASWGRFGRPEGLRYERPATALQRALTSSANSSQLATTVIEVVTAEFSAAVLTRNRCPPGLDVAMREPRAVRLVERISDFGRDLERKVERQRSLRAREPRGERLALEMLHDEITNGGCCRRAFGALASQAEARIIFGARAKAGGLVATVRTRSPRHRSRDPAASM